MPYFENFGYITYDYTVKTDAMPIQETIVDLMQRVDFKISNADLDKMCQKYIIQGSKRPEQISHELYGTTEFHWTILYVNNITDMHQEWPINDNALSDFITKKYGAGNEYDLHHYEKMPEGFWVDNHIDGISPYGSTFMSRTYPEAVIKEVTNYDFEHSLNEDKRRIRVIEPSFIATFVSSFQGAFING